MSLPFITTSDDLKKSVAWANVDPAAFKDQIIIPLCDLIFNNSPLELSTIKSPSFEMAKDNKLCDFMKDDKDRTSQILDPCFISKQIILLSWFITKILSLKIFMLDFNGMPWFLIQISLPLSILIA